MEFCFQDIPKINPLSASPSLIVRINLPPLGENTCHCFHQHLWYWFLESPALQWQACSSQILYLSNSTKKNYKHWDGNNVLLSKDGTPLQTRFWLLYDYPTAQNVWKNNRSYDHTTWGSPICKIKERCQPIPPAFPFEPVITASLMVLVQVEGFSDIAGIC